ncbi:MAG: cold shock and DUF1294 domain-containing protein [Xanthomonadaceae bacterium]|nr:cold shock and DUF1294 domain-containing protein [Xanthomonadaceae bacterium]
MRLVGRITDWNDEKGFGFVVPNGGGDRAFVHANEFQRGSKRPVSGDLISYVAATDQRGRLNAKQIRHAGQKIAVPRAPSRVPRAALGVSALALGAALAFFRVIPFLLLAAITGLSLLAYVMYWVDKSAAQRAGQRTPESTLHLVSLAGGWPGALVAQQQFRHKTIKQPFQSVFWVTVALNAAAVAWLVESGIAAELAQSLSG